jgi:hypothetical protein
MLGLHSLSNCYEPFIEFIHRLKQIICYCLDNNKVTRRSQSPSNLQYFVEVKLIILHKTTITKKLCNNSISAHNKKSV